jgi:hypothetical protein
VVLLLLLLQAGIALQLLLILKKYLAEAYHLTDIRVAGYNPSDATARGLEEKTPVARVGSACVYIVWGEGVGESAS